MMCSSSQIDVAFGMADQSRGHHVIKPEKTMAATSYDEKMCFICYEEETDEHPLICGHCSCRGSMGFYHSSCVVSAAKVNVVNDKIWTHCMQCKQPWKGEMAVMMKRESQKSYQENRITSKLVPLENDARMVAWMAVTGAIDAVRLTGVPLDALVLMQGLRFAFPFIPDISECLEALETSVTDDVLFFIMHFGVETILLLVAFALINSLTNGPPIENAVRLMGVSRENVVILIWGVAFYYGTIPALTLFVSAMWCIAVQEMTRMEE